MEFLLRDEGTAVATRTKLTKSRRAESAEGFGPRLARLRQSRGLTQEEWASAWGSPIA